MLKRELEQKIKDLSQENARLGGDVAYLSQVIVTLKKQISKGKEKMPYLRGQIEVLKRVSGLYPEEIRTREEYKEERIR